MVELKASLASHVCLGFLLVSLTVQAAGAAEPTKPGEVPSPPGFTLQRTGDVHDFEYFAGAWSTKQRAA